MIVGRIKTKLVKRNGEELLKIYPDRFSEDFDDNKKSLPDISEIHSKKLKNVIAGYITRLVRRKNKSK